MTEGGPSGSSEAISQPAERSQNVGQRLVQSDPERLVTVWEMHAGTVVMWADDYPYIAIAMPIPYGMAAPVRVSARAFVQALSNHLDHGDPAVMFASSAPTTDSPVDLSKSTPVGGFHGAGLFEMVINWLSAVSEMDVEAMLVAPESDIAGSVVGLRHDEVKCLAQYFPFGDEEWVSMAEDEEGRILLAGAYAVVIFSPYEVDPQALSEQLGDN